jgi:hypothetical protein
MERRAAADRYSDARNLVGRVTKPKILSVEDILAAQDLKEETVDVPEWGGAVKVKGLTRAQVYEMEKRSKVGKEHDLMKMDALMLEMGVTEPKLTEDAAASLMQKSASGTQVILDAISKLSGMDKGTAAAADRSFPS